MSRTTRRYVPVFYVDFKRDHAATYYNPTALSTWLRLLVASDEAWPSDPELPSAVRRADLAALEADGLLSLGPNRTYAIKGYRADRERRAAGGRPGGLALRLLNDRRTNAERSHSERTTIVGPVSEDQRIRGSEGSTSPLTHTERARSQRLVEPFPA